MAQATDVLAINGGTPVTTAAVPFMSPGLAEPDIEAATKVLRSGMLRAAARCAELEERFAAASGASHALTCANGTCALQLAYGALLEPGSDVLVPSWSFIATAAIAAAAGCRPVFVDALADTYQIDPADAEAKITPKTRAIIATHLYGIPVDIGAIQNLGEKHGFAVIYDAAQAHLARYEGRGIGAFGDAVTYSLYATKNLGTGEGGLVTTNDAATARRMSLLRSHGETDKYLHQSIGFNYRMNDITAAIGCSRLDRLQAENDARRAAAEQYDRIVAAIPGLEPPAVTKNAEAVWHLYTCRFDPTAFTCTRDEFCEALRAEGVPTAVHYPRPLNRQPAFAEFNPDHCPVADRLADTIFCLPMHHALMREHLSAVEEALNKAASAFRV